MLQKYFHLPVMVKEVAKFLKPKPDGIYVDGTLGGGGHALALLRQCQNLNVKCQIIGIDQDEEAIKAAEKRLKKYPQDNICIHDNFRNLEAILDKLKISEVDGILLDLGVSSYQLDEADRGFSFREGVGIRLDMRMDQGQKLSAYEIINNYSEEELKRIFFEFGEEVFSRQIACEVVKRRREKPVRTVSDLVEIIKFSTPPKYRFSRRRHFATKIFRAIRMEVNDELGALREVLPQAVKRLKKGGRLIVISFHSLEDRLAKHFFREKKNVDVIKILTKKPLLPTEKEITLNPRSGSAKMRVVEKC